MSPGVPAESVMRKARTTKLGAIFPSLSRPIYVLCEASAASATATADGGGYSEQSHAA